MTQSKTWEEMETVLKGPGVEIRRFDADGLAQCLIRLDNGMRTDPLFKGLPEDRCQWPHWGYVIKGTMRVHTEEGATDFPAGSVYYWQKGHNLEAVTDTEYLEISSSEDYDHLMDHCHRVMSG
ncbi:hypothetical protein [Corynebacterium sp. A21]|uniref:hypothetical protein n=1 Tax=Corynebacterium sp. A21 TaxID=3457318 RepID=UPI003FD0B084